jgi:chromosome segregation ATPase
MSFVGKILVVVQVVLTILFMAFAGAVYSVQQNWRDAANKQKEQVQKTSQERDALRQEFEGFKTAAEMQLQEQKNLVTELTGKTTVFENQVAMLDATNQDLTRELDTAREQARLNSDEADYRRRQSETQLGVNATLHKSRDELVADLRTLNDKLFALELQQKDMVAKYNDVLQQNAKYRSILTRNKLPTDIDTLTAGETPPPKVDGLVLDTRKSDRGNVELVEVSIGSDDGLAIGHELVVYRGDKYLGKIRLTYVTPDRAVGSVVEPARNATIQRGDNVTTQL